MLEDGSRVIFEVNFKSIMDMLKFSSPESHDQVSLNQENLIMLFHQLSPNSKSKQLKMFLKKSHSIERLALPYPIHVFL